MNTIVKTAIIYNQTRTITSPSCHARIGKNRLTFELSFEQWVKIQIEICNNRKIQAIKLLRTYTHWGLKESKESVESRHNFELGPRVTHGFIDSNWGERRKKELLDCIQSDGLFLWFN